MDGDHGPGGSSRAFTHAVASFDPTDTSVLLWTRLRQGATSASWIVATDPGLATVVASGSAATGAERDGTVVVEVGDLAPASTYWYRFELPTGEVSPVGRTRTLPAGPVEHVRLGTVCCAHYAEAPFGVYRALAEREVDLVLHLGDYIYEEASPRGHRRHDPPGDAITLADYRRRLQQSRSDPDLQALHLRHPVVAIWDDHDFCDNAWREGAKKHDDRRDGPWDDRVAAAVQARQEWLPARLLDPARPLVTWRSVPIGDLAELVLLDTRLLGRDRQAGDDESPPLDDPQRSLLGDEQRSWLAGRLTDGSRPWCVVTSGVVVNELELPWPRPLRWFNRLLPNGYAVLDGRVMHDDQWDGYPAEREWLVRRIDERAEGGGRTVLLSGDVHSSWAFNGPVDRRTARPVAVEFTTPAVSSAAMGQAQWPGLWRVLDRVANDLAHVQWCDVTNRGYTILELSPVEVRSEWWFVHPYDQDPAARARFAAAYAAPRAGWPPGLVEVDQPTTDPERVGLPGPLPARPVELPRLRRHRRARLTAKAVAVAAAAAFVAGVAGRVAMRRVGRVVTG